MRLAFRRFWHLISNRFAPKRGGEIRLRCHSSAVALAVGRVQMLPLPISKEATRALMARADLVVATGSQANIRAAYSSGTPAFGVGAGNVAVIIDEYADTLNAAAQIQRSKTFDNATSCSSENGVVIVESVRLAISKDQTAS
jgi:sulfoacetaldehyde dehydrogenase